MKDFILPLNTLYKLDSDRELFNKRLAEFYTSDENLSDILKFTLSGNGLKYTYNELLCENPSLSKRNLVFVFGNPSPHSIKEQIMFSYEGRFYNTHRVWKVLQETGIINLQEKLLNQSLSDYKSKGVKRNNFVRDGSISTKFNIYMLSYFTMPSASSIPPWAGVAGLKKLFGKKAWNLVLEIEKDRFFQSMKRLPGNSTILVFQKDAYNSIKTQDLNCEVLFVGPTRLWYSKKIKSIFHKIV